MTKDILKELGYLALASRMKRVSDSLYEEVALIYQNAGLELDSRFFPIISILARHGELPVQNVAEHLGITHAGVSILAKALVAKKVLASRADKEDRRRTLLSLSPKTKTIVEKAAPVWTRLEEK